MEISADRNCYYNNSELKQDLDKKIKELEEARSTIEEINKDLEGLLNDDQNIDEIERNLPPEIAVHNPYPNHPRPICSAFGCTIL